MPRRPSRRHFLRASAMFAGAVPIVRAAGLLQAQAAPFRHGVASGDPLADRVVIWTRVTPAGTGPIDVSWVMANDPLLQRVVARGSAQTGVERDYTVKVDVPGLQPATTYYYGFRVPGGPSPTGRTRTTPAGKNERMRLAVVSCSNLPQGFFNAYGRIAERPDLDAVLHLGDYIYEYPNGQYGDGARFGRIPAPDKEIVLPEDYRTRHAQYKLDPDLQEAHRQHPFIVIWDDHELANNTWRDGAENHDPDQGEGEWPARRDAAVQAFFEWMPIREPTQGRPQIARALAFGDLADLIVLDTRLVGRDEQVASRDAVAAIEAPERSLLGKAQEDWLAAELDRSTRGGRRWQLVGQQVMFAPQSPPGKPGTNTDSWDGYRAARDRVFDIVERTRVPNFVVLTGDVHSSWVYDLPKRPYDHYTPSTGRGSLGVEIVGTSVSSPSNIGAGATGEQQLAELRAARPHLHYVDGRYRGYVIVDLSPTRLQADYFAVKTVQERVNDERFVTGFVCEAGSAHLVAATNPSVPKAAIDPAP
ncbi:MAG: alkaline phosphatase D family protein [Acidobacteria bacterium]|nr:alkaline phosphatase D family protein [Acidobacteriota bacterium]